MIYTGKRAVRLRYRPLSSRHERSYPLSSLTPTTRCGVFLDLTTGRDLLPLVDSGNRCVRVAATEFGCDPSHHVIRLPPGGNVRSSSVC